MQDSRFDRNIALFGQEGQARLRSTSVAIVGVGGLGTHVVQQLVMLGVGEIVLIDAEELDDTNRNRYVGVLASDPVPGTFKVEIGKRLALGIDPDLRVATIAGNFISLEGFNALKSADFVFG